MRRKWESLMRLLGFTRSAPPIYPSPKLQEPEPELLKRMERAQRLHVAASKTIAKAALDVVDRSEEAKVTAQRALTTIEAGQRLLDMASEALRVTGDREHR